MIDKKKCLKCGHEWLPRSLEKPRECPKCKRRDWDVPKKKVEEVKAK